MNQTFSGLTLVSFVVLCTLILFIISMFIKPKDKHHLSSKQVSKGGSKSDSFKNKSSKKPTGKLQLFKEQLKSKSPARFKSKKGKFSSASHIQLTRLKKLISQHFADFTPMLRQNHIMLERASQKVAMLTIDKAAAIGRRRLGDIMVINFHDLPSVEELRIELGGV